MPRLKLTLALAGLLAGLVLASGALCMSSLWCGLASAVLARK